MNAFSKLFIWILCVISSCTVMAQGKRALVIGIGEYPVESGWNRINGDRDIDIVNAFLADNGFDKNKIVTLMNSQATKTNIIQQFRLIAASAKPGDQIYIHFSGHGQQVTDIDGDEDDGYDEAWIPYDARKTFAKGVYEGQNHLIDDQINALLRDIRKKIGQTGQLTVVVDACHSGDSSRGEEDEEEDAIVRGTLDKFTIPMGPPVKKTTKQPIQWVMISACKDYQNNYECKVDGNYYGSLSYALYLRRNDVPGKSFGIVGEMIVKTMQGLTTRLQTIQVDSQGDSSEVIFLRKQ